MILTAKCKIKNKNYNNVRENKILFNHVTSLYISSLYVYDNENSSVACAIRQNTKLVRRITR